MSETRQVKQVPPQPQPQAEEEEEQVQSEEETMDPELLKALKNNSIEDDIKNIDMNKKFKTKKGKKVSNKKGDFLDFAQEKGIEFKLQYEDKEDQKKIIIKKTIKTIKEKPIKK